MMMRRTEGGGWRLEAGYLQQKHERTSEATTEAMISQNHHTGRHSFSVELQWATGSAHWESATQLPPQNFAKVSATVLLASSQAAEASLCSSFCCSRWRVPAVLA